MRVTVFNNMSMRPRTPVLWRTGPVTGTLARFSAPRVRYPRIHKGVVSWDGVEASAEQLDAAWVETGFRGAALLFPWSLARAEAVDPADRPRLELLAATDRDLCLNVLGRTRSGLLLADTPLALSRGFLGLELWSDDPRLVGLARATGVKRLTS